MENQQQQESKSFIKIDKKTLVGVTFLLLAIMVSFKDIVYLFK